jgi:hypothetical protein
MKLDDCQKVGSKSEADEKCQGLPGASTRSQHDIGQHPGRGDLGKRNVAYSSGGARQVRSETAILWVDHKPGCALHRLTGIIPNDLVPGEKLFNALGQIMPIIAVVLSTFPAKQFLAPIF